MTTYLAGTPGVPGTGPAAAAERTGGASGARKGGRAGRAGRAAKAAKAAKAVWAAREGKAGQTGPAAPTAPAAVRGTADGRPRTGTGEAARPVPSAGASAAPRRAERPRADCTADTAGGLTFDVRLNRPAGGPSAPGPPGDAALLLRLRGGEEARETVRLPLGPAEGEGMLRAVLPSIMSLAEGRWDAYLALAGEEPQRLLPGVHDLRSLIDRVPRAGRTWLGVRIPYATKYGNLTVRSWLRWPHAEAGPVCVGDGLMTVRGRLYGALLTATARLEAHPRDAGVEPVSVPVLPEGDDERPGNAQPGGGKREHGEHADREHAHAEPAAAEPAGAGHVVTGPAGAESPYAAGGARTGPAPRFSARLPLGALPSGPRVWDLWVRPSADAEPARLARILDDVPDKKQIFSYPPERVTGPDGAFCSVRPYYTRDNDLSVRVSWAQSV